MLATYWNSLDEAISRRVAHVVIGLAVLVAVIFNSIVHVGLDNGLHFVRIGTQFPMPAAIAVPVALEAELTATGTLWFMLVTFAAAPLLTAALEKGWLDLTFSKGTPRWQIFLGRFLGGVTLYSLTALLATLPLALRLWFSTGVATWQILPAIAIQSFSFAAIFSICALAAIPQRGVALPIIAAIGLILVSSPLAHRQQLYYTLISSQRVRDMLDSAYRILPKPSDLIDVCANLIQTGKITSAAWWPIWSTTLFAAAILALALYALHRKSF